MQQEHTDYVRWSHLIVIFAVLVFIAFLSFWVKMILDGAYENGYIHAQLEQSYKDVENSVMLDRPLDYYTATTTQRWCTKEDAGKYPECPN